MSVAPHNFFDLTGKVAMVTGSSRGLGQYMGRALARAGADLVITSRTLADLEPFQAEVEALGRKAFPVALDVRDYDSIQTAVTAAIGHYGKIDILVNNAGLNVRKPAVDITWDDWNLVLETNLRGEFFMAQAVARDTMIPRQHGRIINIGSVTSVFGYAGLTPYSASRGGVKQMTMSLADDWGKHGITVNCLAPGWFKTKQNAVLYENKEWLEYIIDRIPARRPGAPNDLDGAVVYLASDASAYFTGQTMLVDGGISTGATRATVAPKA
ncbi:MAG TPA: glucose 1-dehydrogenase [Bryobacteraceae bacterium]|nr:glucose 1-dehydrogenase [Bryobacteraceae bacterium]